VKLTTHLHLVPRLMREVTSLLPQYIFTAWCLSPGSWCVFPSCKLLPLSIFLLDWYWYWDPQSEPFIFGNSQESSEEGGCRYIATSFSVKMKVYSRRQFKVHFKWVDTWTGNSKDITNRKWTKLALGLYLVWY